MNRYLAALCLACLACVNTAQADPSDPFVARGPEFRFDATTSSGTPVQITASSATVVCKQYRVATFGTAGEKVTMAFGSSSAMVATITAPTTSVSQYTKTIPAGALEVLSDSNSQAFFNAISSTGTIQVFITCGNGV